MRLCAAALSATQPFQCAAAQRGSGEHSQRCVEMKSLDGVWLPVLHSLCRSWCLSPFYESKTCPSFSSWPLGPSRWAVLKCLRWLYALSPHLCVDAVRVLQTDQ